MHRFELALCNLVPVNLVKSIPFFEISRPKALSNPLTAVVRVLGAEI
jgi:hypothetical protein